MTEQKYSREKLDPNRHSRTKTKSPQTNGICERFHKTVLILPRCLPQGVV
jgi:transposase InsO family protein